MKPVLLLLGVIMSLHGYTQQVAKSLTTSKNFFIGFYEFLPADYSANPDKAYPLIIFLHGLGERGNGSSQLSRVTTHGIPKAIKEGHPMRFFWNGKWESFIVLSPQLSESYAVWQTSYVDEILAYAKKNLRIDPNRIALTGMSLGGGGTWSFASRTTANAQALSSIATICGTYKLADMSGIANANLPVWSFHASDDGAVPASNTHTAISRILSHKPAVIPYKTIWPTGNHGIWDRAYDTEYKWQNPNLYEWMLAQDKSLPVNRRPYTNAGADLTVTVGTALTLSGALSRDEDGKIVRYIWRRLSGPVTGKITSPVSEDGITKVTELGVGSYSFELKAVDDRADYTLDTIQVTVVAHATPNIPPVVKAGEDQITMALRAPLTGKESYDPDGTIVSYKWTLEEGPAQFLILEDQAGNTEVINLASGTYKFKLTATDNRGAVRSAIVTINEISTVLGVDFGRIELKSGNDKNIIRWTTTRERNNQYFDIERSADGSNFYSIGRVQGSDSSSTELQYSFEDTRPLRQTAYYRIRQVGHGHQVKYSELLKSRTTPQEILIYPVPAKGHVRIQMSGTYTGTALIRIHGLDGSLQISHQQHIHAGGPVLISLDQLKAGIYILELRTAEGRQLTTRLVKG